VTTCAFVTRGSGFIGGALVRRLVADGWTVRALARSDASADLVRERAPLRFDSPALYSSTKARTSTTHVDNAVEGLVLAAQRGAPGGVYFVTDGRPVVFRDFVTRLIETQGVTPTGRSVPAPVANAVATVGETAWRLLGRRAHLPRPPLTRLAVWLSALETTIDITRVRTELGYALIRTIDEGLEELSKP
jgi:nucleoside-diphosphate-sugar epimerase